MDPLAEYRREICFDKKNRVQEYVAGLHSGLKIAKQIRRDRHDKVDPQTILQTVASKIYLDSERKALLSGYIELPALSV